MLPKNCIIICYIGKIGNPDIAHIERTLFTIHFEQWKYYHFTTTPLFPTMLDHFRTIPGQRVGTLPEIMWAVC